jgi:DNA polymerase-3 subunit beta
MKFIINRDILLNPLQQIVGVIEKRQTMPILANVLMVANDNCLILTGTDLEIQLVSKICIDLKEAGSISVPARKLLDLCRLLPADTNVNFEQDKEKIKIYTAKGRFSLSCLPAEHFPEFAESEMQLSFSLSSQKLKKALEKTTFCMANQDVRYYLNGLMLHISNQKIKYVASDGHRLAVFEDQLDVATGYENRLIIPRKGILELLRLIDHSEALLNIQFSNNHIRIMFDNCIFSAKLVDAKYPDFSKVFQQQFKESITIAKLPLKETLTRVAVLSNEKFKGVTFEFSKGTIKISTHNPDHDEAEESIEIGYQGEPMSIAFNAQYLLDAIASVEAEDVLLTVARNDSCCFIDEPTQCEYKYIVMPMRI